MDIAPDKQNLDRVFSNTSYYIDFYQRDYRWNATPVSRLLDDIFYKFEQHYERLNDLDPSKETVTAKYPWYYLNTYVTNEVDGRVYIVDGQQRLTTLSLILMKLRHLGLQHDSGLTGWIEQKIAGQSGFEQEFWMNHVGHRATQQGLYDKPGDEIDVSTGVTAQNMVENYHVISEFLDERLKGNRHCFETFVFYFLLRLVLINLAVEQTDVSMVFEVINDRGVRLRPYEILKGKLLGQIDKIELDEGDYNALWEGRAGRINAFKEDEFDNFFRFYLKAKFAASRREGQRFDGDYHRVMFESDMNDQLGLLHRPARVKQFLKEDFSYYSELYVRLREAYGEDQEELRPVFYNSLVDIDAPFLLSISACAINDPDETVKIHTVAAEADRLYSLLQLQGAYDSNDFAVALGALSDSIREKPVSEYRGLFDQKLVEIISERRSVKEVEPLSYGAFRNSGINLNTRMKRYFFARIDEFLAREMNLNPKHPIRDLVLRTGHVNGFHVEHILAWNDENRELFGNDQERFEQERNRLGGILLLKGRDNISSNNEVYAQKLKSYANTLHWNETLREDSYKSKLDMNAMKERHGLNLHSLSQFGPEELEERQKLLFDLVSIIWG